MRFRQYLLASAVLAGSAWSVSAQAQDKAADTVREKRKGNCDQGGNPCAEPGVGEYLFDHQAVVVFAWVVVSFSG